MRRPGTGLGTEAQWLHFSPSHRMTHLAASMYGLCGLAPELLLHPGQASFEFILSRDEIAHLGPDTRCARSRVAEGLKGGLPRDRPMPSSRTRNCHQLLHELLQFDDLVLVHRRLLGDGGQHAVLADRCLVPQTACFRLREASTRSQGAAYDRANKLGFASNLEPAFQNRRVLLNDLQFCGGVFGKAGRGGAQVMPELVLGFRQLRHALLAVNEASPQIGHLLVRLGQSVL